MFGALTEASTSKLSEGRIMGASLDPNKLFPGGGGDGRGGLGPPSRNLLLLVNLVVLHQDRQKDLNYCYYYYY